MNALKIQNFVLLFAAALPAVADAQSYRHTSYDYRASSVVVQNDTDAVMTVTVDRGAPETVRPHESERFSAFGKYASIEATYTQFGERRNLAGGLVAVRRDRTTYFDLRPVTVGLMKVVNETGVPADVFIDGREVADLRPGEVEIVKVALGFAHVDMIANGFSVARLDTTIRAFAEPTLVGRAPSVANVTVVNPFPFDVRVSDERGNVRTINARSREVFPGEPVGTVRFMARRLSGEVVDEDQVAVRSWSGATWTPDLPSTGLVRIDSDYGRTARVSANGRIVAMVSAFADETVRLPLGFTTIEVRDLDGALLESARIDVDAWRTVQVNFDAPKRTGAAAYNDDVEQENPRQHEQAEGDHCTMHGHAGG